MNNYFQFKKFTIHQEHCSMKVTEIACILGSWALIPIKAKKILDIGCGTGLLSLMIAQRNKNVLIDAVEIESGCYKQAKNNIENSLYKNQINIINEDIRKYKTDYLYDFIITNPPFFENDLKSPNQQKNNAWHSASLTLSELFIAIDRLLNPLGSFCILFTNERLNELSETAATHGFETNEQLFITSIATQNNPKYVITFFSKKKLVLSSTEIKKMNTQTLIIKENNQYTPDFIKLMQPYYLYL